MNSNSAYASRNASNKNKTLSSGTFNSVKNFTNPRFSGQDTNKPGTNTIKGKDRKSYLDASLKSP